jgi:transposase InsO family protein
MTAGGKRWRRYESSTIAQPTRNLAPQPSRYPDKPVWLLELGVAVSHGRPYHPHTQGKDERFHRTLTAEVIGRRAFADLAECQQRFDAWWVVYNTQRPHEALALATPASRYRPSKRRFPEKIEPFDYGPEAIVHRVDGDGWAELQQSATQGR